MRYLIGVDEAGYAPNLGPLVIAGSVWQLDDDAASDDLYALLSPSVRSTVHRDCLTICDSKLLHRASDNLSSLEQNVLPIWLSLADEARTPDSGKRLPRWFEGDWRHLARLLDCSLTHEHYRAPQGDAQQSFAWACASETSGTQPDHWFYESNEPLALPVACDEAAIVDRAEQFSNALDRCGVRLARLAFVEISPRRFNREVESSRSKGALLTRATLALVADLIHGCHSAHGIKVVCDKHGGRNRYASALRSQFSNCQLAARTESEAISEYDWIQPHGARVDLAFQARGESFLPTALASMVAKYIRELRMELWNRFWRLRIPDLKPTKGYPLDAARFLREIEPTLQQMDRPLVDIWRER